jgi:L-ascorbate metabolism protein UlaG (beta-lactamase superfamily)
MSKQVYLKQNILMEPLFNQWYAWLGLISPATAALYIANSHLKIMQSFVSAPQVHISALKNPKMMGGPFINHDVGVVSDIRALMEETTRAQADMLKLAEDIKVLDEMLGSEGTGYSLNHIYERVPESLKGYVELIYDLNNHPTFRLIEGLLYQSKYYNESNQSIALSVVDNDDRAFVFSTPRLKDRSQLQLRVPFADEAIDRLFRMKTAPDSLDAITEALNVEAEDADVFSSFFTEQAPEPAPRYTGDQVRIRYFGHATVLIETKEIAILTDPVISYNHGNGIERFTFADLPETIDYILITHNHQDHCMLETLLQLRHKTSNIVVPKNGGGSLSDPSMKLALRQIGFKNVLEIDEMETIEVEGGGITGLPFLGEHADLNIRSKIAYLVSLAGKSVLCAADSNNIEPAMYRHIHERVKDVEVVFLGMECDGAPLSWIYGSLLTKPLARKLDQSRRLNGSDCERGMGIVDHLNPRQVYVYAMGMEPWLTFVTAIHYTPDSRPILESDKLVEECLRRGIQSERLFGQKEIFL